MSQPAPSNPAGRIATTRRIALAVALLVAILASFAFGRYTAARAELEVRQLREDALAGLNALGQYRAFADIAIHLRHDRQGRAQCSAEVVASIMIEELRKCLASASCRAVVVDQVERSAPELLASDAELGFRYYKSGEACFPANKVR